LDHNKRLLGVGAKPQHFDLRQAHAVHTAPGGQNERCCRECTNITNMLVQIQTAGMRRHRKNNNTTTQQEGQTCA
jgi:hypothetical protein